MTNRLGGTGVGLPVPTGLYPPYLYNAPIDIPSNGITLQPGQTIPLQAGSAWVHPGKYSFLQFLDPITGTWRIVNSARDRLHYVQSDGFNVRLANLLGCPVGAIVTASNGGYAQSTTTVTPSVGNSTWQAIVGGMVSVISVASAGLGYTIPPLVVIGAPPNPGIQATGYAVLTGTSVSSVVLANVGGGYTSVPPISIVPNPNDPALAAGTITAQAVASIALVGGTTSSGSLVGVLCTNPGVSVASVPTLTIAGAGTAGAATAVRLTALTGATVVAAGTGMTDGAILQAVLGVPSATPLWTNPETDFTQFVPRPAMANMAVAGGSLVSVASIVDGGMFAGTPAALVIPKSGYITTTAASVTLTTGTFNDTVVIQNPGT